MTPDDATGATALAMLDEVVLGSARGGAKPAADASCTVVRALTPEDLPLLRNPPPVGSKTPGLLELRAPHHQLARLLATGVTQAEASLITGYSPSRISLLCDDPLFEELLAHYASEREQVFVDVAERMKVLGLATLEELHQRLETAPQDFARRELMELAELMLLKGRAGPGSSQGAGPGHGGATGAPALSINVSFVKAPELGTPAITIEQEPQR